MKVENLFFEYGSSQGPVLQNVSIEIKNGEYVAIIGPNGCGKTTLIKHMNGLLIPTEGNVWVNRMNTRDPATIHEIRQKVGMVFQNPENQIVGMSVEEDVAFGPENLCLPPEEIQKRVKQSLEIVGMGGIPKGPLIPFQVVKNSL